MAVRVIVVDDEVNARRKITQLLADEPDTEVVGEFATVPEAIAGIRQLAPDVVFLDIQIRAMSGFDVVRGIGVDRMPATVFVTAFDEHAVNAFEVQAIDYLLKPFDRPRFQKAYARARSASGSTPLHSIEHQLRALAQDIAARQAPGAEAPRRHLEWIVVKGGDRNLRLVSTAELEWVEAAGNYVYLHLGGGRRELHREALRSLYEKLDPARFVRIHRSAIVNLSSIESLAPWFAGDYQVRLKSGGSVRLSRHYREEFEKRVGRTE